MIFSHVCYHQHSCYIHPHTSSPRIWTKGRHCVCRGHSVKSVPNTIPPPPPPNRSNMNQWYSDCKCWTCFAAAVWYTRNFILSDATHDTHSPKFCTLQPLLAQQEVLYFSLMQPMSPTTTQSAAFRKPTGAYQRKTQYIVAAVKWYVFVVPPPPPPPAPGGNRHFVTVPLPLGGGGTGLTKGGRFQRGGGTWLTRHASLDGHQYASFHVQQDGPHTDWWRDWSDDWRVLQQLAGLPSTGVRG